VGTQKRFKPCASGDRRWLRSNCFLSPLNSGLRPDEVRIDDLGLGSVGDMSNTDTTLTCALCGASTPAHAIQVACDGSAYCSESVHRDQPPIEAEAMGPGCARRASARPGWDEPDYD